jgi:phosphatidate cytidylyltransferase
MLRKRIITALWGIPLLVVVIWFSEPEWSFPLFTAFVSLWGLLATFEFYKITAISRIMPLAGFGIIWSVLFIIRPHFTSNLYYPVVLASLLALPMIFLLIRRRGNGIVNTWAWTVTGVLYVGLLLSYLVDLRLDGGRNWVFLAILATFGSDTTAYFVGKAFGRHHMAPRISPNKTWEGGIAGVFGAIIVSLLFTLSWPLQLPVNHWQAILLGVLISVFGQLGDLLESLLKRFTGVKESGSLMPGHGGLLDRMDSIVFAGVVVYIYYIFFVL